MFRRDPPWFHFVARPSPVAGSTARPAISPRLLSPLGTPAAWISETLYLDVCAHASCENITQTTAHKTTAIAPTEITLLENTLRLELYPPLMAVLSWRLVMVSKSASER